MKILLINKYHFIKGGAERVVFNTAKLLEEQGHEVIFFSMRHPKNFPSKHEKYFISEVKTDRPGFKQALLAFGRSFYSPEAAGNLEKLIAETKPDVAHLHFFHQVAATVLPILKKHGIPVVLTAHDYKLVCPHYHLNDQGISCPKGHLAHAWQTIRLRRFKNSLAASMAVAVEWLWHKKTRLYEKYVEVVVTPAEYSARLLIEYGWPKEKIGVLRNFVYPSGGERKYPGDYVLFVGRLSAEKGLGLLAETARLLPDVPFLVVGAGDEKLPDLANVKYLGFKSGAELEAIYQQSAMLFFPSLWAEVCPMVILEAASNCLPVVASNLGGVPEMVIDQKSGYLFDPLAADARQPAKLVLDLWRDSAKQMHYGLAGKKLVQVSYSPTKHYEQLISLYGLLASKAGKEEER